MFGILTVVFIVISVVMVLVILVQRPSGGGLSGAFGGAGGGGADTVFGGRVGDALTWATSLIFIAFLLVAIGLNWLDDDPNQPSNNAAADSTEDVSGESGDGADAGDGEIDLSDLLENDTGEDNTSSGEPEGSSAGEGDEAGAADNTAGGDGDE